ncbi:ABC transporter permease [Pseudomonas sp. NPDC087342]|uniref:ABC transporter permease n=1 Tax=Pseudomonas sp. NPDC087342 TaxID=3364437 RepID=UPI00381F2EF0
MLRLYVLAFLAFLFLPILVITLFAFHSTTAMSFPFEGFSLRWFEVILSDDNFVNSLKNSVIVATASSIATCLLGTFAALAIPRLSKRPKAAFSFLAFAPIALPGLFLGIGLLVLFDMLGVHRSLVTVTIAHTLFCLPFFIETVRSRVTFFDADLELAGRDLGAGPFAAFRLITLPILAPTLLGGTILSFALSFDEIVITVFVIGEQSTLPFYILSAMRRTVNPTINAASVLAMGMTLVLLLVAGVILGMQKRRAIQQRSADREE